MKALRRLQDTPICPYANCRPCVKAQKELAPVCGSFYDVYRTYMDVEHDSTKQV